MQHSETHRMHRIGWLRAAVLGANDGLISTASLVVGVAASAVDKPAVLIAGLAGIVAGAMSMATGEYVSVSSQSDTELADLERERRELEEQPELELRELSFIYQKRGISPDLADQVAQQLTAHDALGAHARDELGITDMTSANPIQAAIASAAAFSVGAILPILIAWLSPRNTIVIGVAIATVIALAILGVISARLGGAAVLRPTLRVTLWGILAMLFTYGVGLLFNVSVG